MKRLIKGILPPALRTPLLSAYHFAFAWLADMIYRHPSRELFVIGITGTKGKTTTVELIRAILERAGYKVAATSTLSFSIAGKEIRNMHKMSMPGRFFIQQFLRRAITAGCDYAVIEMTSEGAAQHRHRFIALDTLIFTNLAPEHIESHGSFAAYRDAKLSLARQLERARKTDKTIIVNADDAEARRFLGIHVPNKKEYRLRDAEPIERTARGIVLTYAGFRIPTHLHGTFDVYNILAAITFARTRQIGLPYIAEALHAYRGTRGRMEYIHRADERLPFSIIVDYAHTPHSLEAVYASVEGKKVCVFGATGGGRDKWKRPAFGAIAAARCDTIILTNEDPYDEDPRQIVNDIIGGIEDKEYAVIMDRRGAIAAALAKAPPGGTVIITGKGTDPYIMGPRGAKEPWDDATVVREEIKKIYS